MEDDIMLGMTELGRIFIGRLNSETLSNVYEVMLTGTTKEQAKVEFAPVMFPFADKDPKDIDSSKFLCFTKPKPEIIDLYRKVTSGLVTAQSIPPFPGTGPGGLGRRH